MRWLPPHWQSSCTDVIVNQSDFGKLAPAVWYREVGAGSRDRLETLRPVPMATRTKSISYIPLPSPVAHYRHSHIDGRSQVHAGAPDLYNLHFSDQVLA